MVWNFYSLGVALQTPWPLNFIRRGRSWAVRNRSLENRGRLDSLIASRVTRTEWSVKYPQQYHSKSQSKKPVEPKRNEKHPFSPQKT